MEAYFNETRGRDHDAVRDIFRVAGNLPEGAPAPDNPRLDDGGGKGLKGLEACEHWHTMVKGMLRSKKGITSETKRFLFSFLRVHPAWEVAFGGAPCKAFQFRGDCAHHCNDHRAYYVGQMQTPLKPFTVFLQHDDRKEIRVYPFNVYQIIRGADFTPSDDRWHDLSAQAVREVARDIAQYGYLDGRDEFF